MRCCFGCGSAELDGLDLERLDLEKEVTLRGHPRPEAATRIVDRVKLHRHVARLDGEQYTVITPRPGTDARFSTNQFHGTWHILSDLHGARLLGRLLWGLAYQRVPRTMVLIDRPFIDPNPFDAAPADPIALVPALLTPLRTRSARQLRQRLPLTTPAGTVRWHTPGLAAALAEQRRDRAPGERRAPWIAPRGFQERIDRIGGLLVLAATPSVLREWAVTVYRLGEYAYEGMAYTEIGWPDGEVQVFTDYRRRVGAARVARREILAELPHLLAPPDLEPLIWQRGTAVRQRSRRPVTAEEA
jgi:hypothetical protein